jgi:hypothetical protein
MRVPRPSPVLGIAIPPPAALAKGRAALAASLHPIASDLMIDADQQLIARLP